MLTNQCSCGSSPQMTRYLDGDDTVTRAVVRCKRCKIQTEGNTEEAATERWNRLHPKHFCHWPGCKIKVPPKFWGCKAHWFALPKTLRDRIWATYRPGQEITKDPSPEYIAAARDVREWILKKEAGAIEKGA